MYKYQQKFSFRKEDKHNSIFSKWNDRKDTNIENEEEWNHRRRRDHKEKSKIKAKEISLLR